MGIHLAAAGLIGASLGPALAAPETDCAKYHLRGLSPGLTEREVRQVMGGRGEGRSESRGPEGWFSSVTYHEDRVSVYVQYDRLVGKSKSRARVVLVRTIIEDADLDVPSFMRALVEIYGEPARGREVLDDGAGEGRAVWVDEECDVVLTTFRGAADWWEPSGGSRTHVQVESLTRLRQTATRRNGTDLVGEAPADGAE